MDIVYLLKNDDLNEELRYSLRSLKNLPHDRVFFAGHQPYWTKNVTHIETDQVGKPKHVNTFNNLLAACEHPEVSDDFILMNDDMFIMQPLKELPLYHRGKIKDVLEEAYDTGRVTLSIQRMEKTLVYLENTGYKDPLCYELHIPMVINKKRWLTLHKDPSLVEYNKRTLYGNFYGLGGEQRRDVKIRRVEQKIPDDFISTADRSFKMLWVGEIIRERFVEYCKYERTDGLSE